jgi:hypothetical protein
MCPVDNNLLNKKKSAIKLVETDEVCQLTNLEEELSKDLKVL